VVQRPSVGLFGRHEGWGANDRPLAGQARVVTDRPGQAEVEDDDPAPLPLQPDIVGLEVPVDQADGMGGVQPLGNLAADPRDLGRRQRPVAPQPGFERFAAEQGHGQVGEPPVLAHPVDRDDMVTPDGGGGLGLAEESPPGRIARCQGGPHHFQRHESIQCHFLGAVDDPHPPRTDPAQDPIGAEPANLVGRLRRGQEVVAIGAEPGVGDFDRRGRDSAGGGGRGPSGRERPEQVADPPDERLDPLVIRAIGGDGLGSHRLDQRVDGRDLPGGSEASATTRQVPTHLRRLVLGQPPQEEAAQSLVVKASAIRGHHGPRGDPVARGILASSRPIGRDGPPPRKTMRPAGRT